MTWWPFRRKTAAAARQPLDTHSLIMWQLIGGSLLAELPGTSQVLEHGEAEQLLHAAAYSSHFRQPWGQA